MKIEEMISEEMYVFVAPDGTPQITTLAPDFPMCIAITKMLSKSGMFQSPEKLIEQGYHIIPVKVSIIQNGDENTAFNNAVLNLQN